MYRSKTINRVALRGKVTEKILFYSILIGKTFLGIQPSSMCTTGSHSVNEVESVTRWERSAITQFFITPDPCAHFSWKLKLLYKTEQTRVQYNKKNEKNVYTHQDSSEQRWPCHASFCSSTICSQWRTMLTFREINKLTDRQNPSLPKMEKDPWSWEWLHSSSVYQKCCDKKRKEAWLEFHEFHAKKQLCL